MTVEVVGVSAADQLPDPTDVLRRAITRFRQLKALKERQRNQVIRFHEYPVGIAFIADQHIGDEGTDYERIFSELDRMIRVENLYFFQVGDLINNFIINKLMQKRMGSKISIDEEWALARYYLELMSSRLLGVVGGNHEYWTKSIAGFDQLKQLSALVKQDMLYHPDEIRVRIELVGHRNKALAEWPARIRHKWKGASKYNATHAIERAFADDQGKHFVLGVGAHTHVSGLVRQFNAGTKQGTAVICGSYKVYDDFAEQLGLPQPNDSTAVIVTFDPMTGMQGYNNIQAGIARLS